MSLCSSSAGFTTSMASPRRVLVFTKYSTGWPRSFSRILCNLQLAMACTTARGMAFQVCWPPHSPLGTKNLEQVCQILEVSADIKRKNLAEPLSSPLLMVAAWCQYHFGGDLKSWIWICQKKWNNQLQSVYSTWMSNNSMPLILSPQHGTPSHE